MCPRVTVIIPTYNCKEYISEAVDSVLNQTFQDFEIIVADDGSTDNTKEVLSRYISVNVIRYYYQNNSGVAAARNKGLREAKGDLIAFLDADDKWLPQRLEKSLEFLERNKCDWTCSSFFRRERDTGKTEIKRLDKKSLLDDSYVIDMLKDGLFYFSSKNIHTNTILVKQKCFEKVGFFDEKFHSGEDWDMWIRFEEAGFKGVYLDMPLAYYNIRSDGITKSSRSRTVDYHFELALKHAHILGIHNIKIRRSLGAICYKYADIYYNEHKNYVKAISYIFKGLYYYPQIKKILYAIRILIYKNILSK